MVDIPKPERELSPEREPEPEPSPELPKAKKRGRPPGAKNKPKLEAPPPAEEAKPKRRRQVIVVESSSSSEEEIVVKRKRRPEVAREETRSLAPSDHTTLDDIAQSLHSAHLQRAIAQKMTYDGYFSRLK